MNPESAKKRAARRRSAQEAHESAVAALAGLRHWSAEHAADLGPDARVLEECLRSSLLWFLGSAPEGSPCQSVHNLLDSMAERGRL